MVSPTNTQQPVVEALGLTKVFRDFWMRTKAVAVDGVDFTIHPHEVFGLLGPNGSGKSTIIKMILGLLHCSRGRLAVFGKPPTEVTTKKYIGFLPEESYMYRFLNARETLDYYGKLFGLDRRTRQRRTDELLDMLGLTAVAHRAVGEFSKGMTRRVGLAQALINDPDFLILDEPTAGLDPIGTRQVKDLIIELARRGKTILLSSHLLSDVEDVCDRITVLYGGKIRAEGTADELLRDTEHTVIRTGRLKSETVSAIDRVLQESEGTGIDSVEAPRQRLEQYFLEIVEKAREEEVETSGAVHGGSTAGFLRADDQEGEAVIDTLMREDEVPMRARAVEVQRAADVTIQSDEVLANLMKGREESDEVAPRAKVMPAAPDAPVDVDSSMIADLMGDESGGSGGSGESSEEDDKDTGR